MNIQPSFIETHDVRSTSILLEDVFSHYARSLTNLTPYKYIFPNQKDWGPEDSFRSAEINFLLGNALEKLLPEKTISSIQRLGNGEFPRVIALKGMPTGQSGKDIPEKEWPFCAMTLRGLSALLTKRDVDWEHANFGRNIKFHSNKDTSLQPMHCDYSDDADGNAYESERPFTNQIFSILHYIKTDGITPTWFTPYNIEDAQKAPNRERHIPVIAKSGDVLIFNNIRVLHARGQPPEEGATDTPAQRHFIGINMAMPYEPLGIKPCQLPNRPDVASLKALVEAYL